MTTKEFMDQILRLSETYGEKFYNKERTKLIWEEVSAFDVSWLRRQVDHFIGEMRQPPMVKDFREAATLERERLHAIEKKRLQEQAEEFFAPKISADEQSMFLNAITKRIKGQLSDKDWAPAKKLMDEAARLQGPQTCKTCDDSGVVLQEDEQHYVYVCKCFCPKGLADPRAYPSYRVIRKKGESK